MSEESLSSDPALEVLTYERASQVIETATHIGVGLCYCRHKMEHLDRACSAPMDICMTFNTSAASLTRHGIARTVDAVECLDLLQEARDHGLVQFGENVQRHVNFICNCWGCCCEAMSLVSANDPLKPKRKTLRLHEDLCLGCGVCVPACPTNAIRLKTRDRRVITPVDSTRRTVAMAVERGTLQHLIFDNHGLASHRVMAAVLGTILRLPPANWGHATWTN